ncbi:flagellar hook protein FlgE [Falsiroseomonas selenitidurans]|uniref:Flagellar hook protein FlgE n=1 Tax=Falsiroseomonas selenitidurans TaxID=2716335 RepID=A0ABX1EAL1_9PROT|nr:flagellar hook protein FlgE [Falsiroseomonas selenitidurans]NKC33993.1 flagellar hook protein FlgE [Falsiroseomonas selenitidurans]
MSLFGSLSTAVSGMNAQSRALGHIADNVANSQTVGYKRQDTNFEDLVAAYGRGQAAGGVIASADATNDVQGAISQVDNPLALALNGRGFFSVARPLTTAGGGASFDGREMFSRAGDFQLNAEGYLANSSGDVLQGWVQGADGTLDVGQLRPIQADRNGLAPAATGEIVLSANLPASAAVGTGGTTEAQFYDSLGTLQTMKLAWSRAAADNSWTLDVSQPATAAGGAATPLGSYTVTFGTNGAPAGTIGEVRAADGTVLGGYAPGTTADAVIDLAPVSAGVAQPLALNLGRFGAAAGVTQYAGSTYELRSVERDGAPAGAFASMAVQDDGRVVVNYDNGQSRTIAQVPVVTFADPDALERLDGQAFALTAEAGRQQVVAAGASGSGTLQAAAVEGSNVDLASEFAKLIVAQRAYSASTKIVTTSDEMLQETLSLKR